MRASIISLILAHFILFSSKGQEQGFYKLSGTKNSNSKQIYFLQDGSMIVLTDRSLDLRHYNDLSLLKTIKVSKNDVITLNDNQGFLFRASKNGKIIQHETSSLNEIRSKTISKNELTSIVSSQDRIFVGTEEGDILCLDRELNTLWRTNISKDRITVIKYAKLGLIISSKNRIHLLSNEDGTVKSTSSEHRDLIRSVDLSSNEKYLVSAGNDRRLILWKILDDLTLKRLQSFKDVHIDWIYDIKFNPYSSFVMTSSFDRGIKVFKFLKEKETLIFQESLDVGAKIFHYLSRFDLDPSSYRLAVGTFGDGIYVSDVFQTRNSVLHRFSKLQINKEDLKDSFDTIRVHKAELELSLIFDKPRIINEVKASVNGRLIPSSFNTGNGKLVLNALIDNGRNVLTLYVDDIYPGIPPSEYLFEIIKLQE